MMDFLFLTIIFPLLGFVVLTCFQRFLCRNMISVVGIGSIFLSGLVVLFIVVDFLHYANCDVGDMFFFIQPIFIWMKGSNFVIPIGLRLDGLSLSMLVMIILVSFLIHLYTTWYISNDVLYSRIFSYMNLFVANMILLILADNLLLMYVGWEGVGLCSYLLIGFYYTNVKYGELALKAFIMTRIGDIFLICAMFMLYKYFHTLDFYELAKIPVESFVVGNISNVVVLCLLIAVIAKSAQFPLQSWLLGAMVAPTPVSALIHAATMVTAGVYLISRTYSLFIMAPEVLYAVGVIGSITLLLSSVSALLENDLKKILAYSTMGQISYMFIALSVYAKESAIFHLIMHAFFKALLFLASASLILMCRGEQNIFKMGGGLYRSTPLIYFSFLLGGASLSAVPMITSGFVSKGDILWKIVLSGNNIFIVAGLLGSFLTTLYTFRMIFIIFHSNSNISILKFDNSFFHYFPLLVLSVLSTFLGTYIKIPIVNECLFMFSVNDFNKLGFEFFLNFLVVSGFSLSAIYYVFSYRIFVNKLLKHVILVIRKFFIRCCSVDWGADWIFKNIFVRPYLLIARSLFFDPVNIMSNFIIFVVKFSSGKLILSANGQLRYYLTFMLFGVVIIFLLLVFL